MPLIRGDGESSFTVDGESDWTYKKVLNVLNAGDLVPGSASERFDLVIRVSRVGTVQFSHHGYVLGFTSDVNEFPLVGRAAAAVGARAFKARAYIWRSQHDKRFGLRVYLPAGASVE